MKAPKVNDDALQTGGTFTRKLSHDKIHWPKPVPGSGVAYQLCQWASGEKVIVHIQNCIWCNVNICVKYFSLFHTSRTLVEDKQAIASPEKDHLRKGKNANNQNWKGKNKKSGQTAVWCCGSSFDWGSCGASASGQDQNYGIRPVGGYGAVGDRVCDRNQNILKLMSSLKFSQL